MHSVLGWLPEVGGRGRDSTGVAGTLGLRHTKAPELGAFVLVMKGSDGSVGTSEIDREARTAVCRNCGPVKIRSKHRASGKHGWRCTVGERRWGQGGPNRHRNGVDWPSAIPQV